jgi:hypothetical protein
VVDFEPELQGVNLVYWRRLRNNLQTCQQRVGSS